VSKRRSLMYPSCWSQGHRCNPVNSVMCHDRQRRPAPTWWWRAARSSAPRTPPRSCGRCASRWTRRRRPQPAAIAPASPAHDHMQAVEAASEHVQQRSHVFYSQKDSLGRQHQRAKLLILYIHSVRGCDHCNTAETTVRLSRSLSGWDKLQLHGTLTGCVSHACCLSIETFSAKTPAPGWVQWFPPAVYVWRSHGRRLQ